MNKNQPLSGSECSVVEWLGYEQKINAPGSVPNHTTSNLFFLLEFATEFFP